MSFQSFRAWAYDTFTTKLQPFVARHYELVIIGLVVLVLFLVVLLAIIIF